MNKHRGVWGFLGLGIVFLTFGADFLQNLPQDQENYTRELTHTAIVPERKVLTSIHKNIDQEWLPILKYGNIVSVKPIKGEVSGLAEKWLAVFDTGHEAMLKPVETWSFLDQNWPTLNYSSEIEASGWRIRRADRRMQGFNEIVAYYLDRTLGLYRKPPIIGRYLSSKLLYSYAFNTDEDIVWSAYDAFAEVKNLMPEQAIPVSVHGWFDGLKRAHPPLQIHEFLTMQLKSSQLGKWEKAYAADISDTIVFDFLIDDHDRGKEHNWMIDANKNALLWDSGLAFNHGPYGREACARLLCGPEKWIEKSIKEGETQCTKICRFRNSTITSLYSMSSKLVSFDNTLGGHLKKALQSDILDPVFQFNLYYIYGRWPKTRFRNIDFFEGLNSKVERFLSHVDECISLYGRDRVFINY